jgi:hypothetical protein
VTRRFDCVDILKKELEAVGASYRIEVKKHAKVWINHNGKDHLYCCGITTGATNRSMENTRAGIRRLLRQLGLLASKQNRG